MEKSPRQAISQAIRYLWPHLGMAKQKAAPLKWYSLYRAVETTATQYFQNSCLPNQTRIHTQYYTGVVVSFRCLSFFYRIEYSISDSSVCFVM